MMDSLWSEITKVNPYTQCSCYGHLDKSNGQPALGKIMAGAYQPASYSRTEGFHSIVGMGDINLGYSGIWKELPKQVTPYHFCIVRAGHFLACCANQVKQITGCLERH